MPTANLSVVIANRNHARHLPRALEAVLAQAPGPREVIVLDDASTDDSRSVLELFARRDPRIRVSHNPGHLGVAATYNRGFELATSDYILPGAADDYILPGFIDRAMTELERRPRAGLCLTFGSCTEGDEGPLVVNDPGWCEQPTYFSPEEVCRKLWHALPVSAIVIRRDALLAVGGYRQELEWYSDWFAFLVVAFRHGLVHIPATLGIHVARPESYASQVKCPEQHQAVLGRLIDLLVSAEYADVDGHFRRNGAACRFGIDFARAATRRDDYREPAILGLLAGYTLEEFERMSIDVEPRLREIAAIFLAEPWRGLVGRRGDLESETRRLVEEIQLTRLRVAPSGTIGKLRWAAGLLRRRVRRAVGLHPAGRFR